MKMHNNVLMSLLLAVALLLAGILVPGYAAAAEEDGSIQLLPPRMDRPATLMTAVKNRRSSRTFSEADLPLETLSDLMWTAYGINRPGGMRTVPSAHNWQAIDLYVAMKNGLYLYSAAKNSLDLVKSEDLRRICGKQGFTQDAPVNLIYVADYSRMSRDIVTNVFFSATDASFISQNVYLFCAAEGLSTVVLAWVDKPALSKAMGLKNYQKIVLTQPVGYPPGKP